MRFFDAVVPKRIVYLLDVSGSVDPEQRRVMRDELERSVAQLDVGQQYQVVLFDHETYYQLPHHYITVGPNHQLPCIDFLQGYGGSDAPAAIQSVMETYPDVNVIVVATDKLYSEGEYDFIVSGRVVVVTIPGTQKVRRGD